MKRSREVIETSTCWICFFYLLACVSYHTVLGQYKKVVLYQDSPKLYYSMGKLSPSATSFQLANHILNVYTIGIHDYNDITNGTLEKEIRGVFPDSTMSGIGVLDWEGWEWTIIRKNFPGDSRYRQCVDRYLNAIRIAKAIRPNVLWGVYSMPFKANINLPLDTTEIKSKVPDTLLQVCDVFFPSLYQSSHISKETNERIAYNLKGILALAKFYHKPVLPYVWHRYHPGNRQLGYQLIPSDEFIEHIRQILSVSIDNTKVSGIIWWGGSSVDRYYLNRKVPALLNEVRSNSDFQSHEDRIIIDNSKKILNVMKAVLSE